MSWRRFAALSFACSCLTRPAQAHAPPLANGIVWLTDDAGERAIVRTNRGLIVEDAGGAGFRIVCNEAFDVALAEVPPIAVGASGRLLLGTYAANLVVSSPDRCDYDSASGPLDGLYPIDVKANAQGLIYAAVLPLDGSSAELLTTSDQGKSAQSLALLPGAPSALQIAPSDDSRVYVSVTTAEGNESHGILLGSSDGGQSFEQHPIELDASELRVFLLAVAPGNSDLLLARTQSRDGMTPERLLRSDDGGATFETVLSAPGPLSALVQEDGTVWAGAADGLYRSDDDGASFQQVDQTSDLSRITCLAEHGGSVYACAFSAGEFGVLSSADGRAFEWFLRFPQVSARLDCAADTDEGKLCGDAFADWSEEQGSSSTPEPGPHPEEGGTASAEPGAATDPDPPKAARSRAGGCQLSAPASTSVGMLFVGLALGLGARRYVWRGARA